MKRWQSIKDHKVFKYSKYVIGEVFIVIVGIILALQLNNWNENRKNEILTRNLFKEIQGDLLVTLGQVQRAEEYYNNFYLSMKSVLADTLSYDDYKRNRDLPYTAMGVSLFRSPRIGINKLNNSLVSLPEKFNDLYNELTLYYSGLESLRTSHVVLYQKMTNNHDYMVKEYDWYSQGVRSEAMIDFQLNDPYYKNYVFLYLNVLNDFNLYSAKNETLRTYSSLAEITGLNELSENYRRILDTDLEQYAGTYQWKDSVKIKEWGERTIRVDRGRLNYNDQAVFFIQNKDSFAHYYYDTLFFKRDSAGQITGATRFYEGEFFELEKMD